MKNLAKLNGAKALSRTEQKSINGGGRGTCPVPTTQRLCEDIGGYWFGKCLYNICYCC